MKTDELVAFLHDVQHATTEVAELGGVKVSKSVSSSEAAVAKVARDLRERSQRFAVDTVSGFRGEKIAPKQ